MKKLKLIRGFLMTAIIAGGIVVFAGNGYASLYAGAGNRTDDTTESSRDSGYIGAGNRTDNITTESSRSLYAGAGNRSEDAAVLENETDIETLISEVITMIWG